MSELYDIYQNVGNESFGKVVGEMAPYFATIDPVFHELRPGYCEILIPNTESVRNHLGTLHAIAMCNGAELVAGLTTDVSIPSGRRWIPVGMQVQYLAMAKHDAVVRTNAEHVDWTVTGDIPVDVEVMVDEQRVMTATIAMRVTEK